MRIMGVDPGTLITGFGVIDCQGGAMVLVDYGIIRMKGSVSLPERLGTIHSELLSVIDRTNPDAFAIESAFYSKNVQSTLKLGHARGVAILAAVLRQIPTAEYAPREVKLSITGTGNASKDQVGFMVSSLLSMTNRFTADATDALALAICHANRSNRPRSRQRDWKSFILDNPDRVATIR